MLIFANEDRSYLSWLAHHRHGFVLDMLRKPTRKQPVVHRAICGEIKASKSKRTHWTTGRHIKACSLDMNELLAWAEAEAEAESVYREQCRPTDETSHTAAHERHLTKLGKDKDIVDYVVEAAVAFLDQDAEYDATVGDLAHYLGKTPAQIRSALLRLVEDGFLRIEGDFDAQNALPSQRKIYPTADALRMLPAFEQMPVREVEEELEHLVDDLA